jgi:EKC/KEOPS complex subunit PCC1/LAGE3
MNTGLILYSVISTPFPTHRLAVSALKALQVDEELSPMVRRTFSLATAKRSGISASSDATAIGYDSDECKTVLRTEYKAKTNRMLRVAVNGFMESLGVVLGVMERLDVDVLAGHST